MIGTPGAAEQEAALDGLARSLGTRLTGVLLSEEARATVVRRLHAVDRGRARLSLRVHGGTEESDRALALPWELLMPEPGELAVRANKLAIVRDAVTEWSPLLQEPTAPLTLAVTIAAPEDQGSLRYEDEAFRLQRSLVPLGHAVAFADLGDVDELVRVASGVSAAALHFSGHGLPGALVFENELGFAEPMKVEDLVAKLRLNLTPSAKGGSFPKLFFLASCHGASGGSSPGSTSASGGCRSDGPENDRHARALDTAIGRGPSTAAALHRSGFVQVGSRDKRSSRTHPRPGRRLRSNGVPPPKGAAKAGRLCRQHGDPAGRTEDRRRRKSRNLAPRGAFMLGGSGATRRGRLGNGLDPLCVDRARPERVGTDRSDAAGRCASNDRNVRTPSTFAPRCSEPACRARRWPSPHG